MKASYKTAAIAKAQATARTKKTGNPHVFFEQDGEFIVMLEIDREEMLKAAWAAGQIAAMAALKAGDEVANVIALPVRRRAKTPEGVGYASWKWITERLPEDLASITDVRVRKGNGKRFYLDVNGVEVWYSFTEDGANIAAAAVMNLRIA